MIQFNYQTYFYASLSNRICHACNHEIVLSTGDIFYDGKFFHEKCDPLPNIRCLGGLSNNLIKK